MNVTLARVRATIVALEKP